MRILQEFITHHSNEDLMVLGFFVTLASCVAGWVVDMSMGKHGFGVMGNAILVMMGSVVGGVVAESYHSFQAISEVNRIIFFSAVATTILLVTCFAIKNRRAVV